MAVNTPSPLIRSAFAAVLAIPLALGAAGCGTQPPSPVPAPTLPVRTPQADPIRGETDRLEGAAEDGQRNDRQGRP